VAEVDPGQADEGREQGQPAPGEHLHPPAAHMSRTR
jgi:hypothetical protein